MSKRQEVHNLAIRLEAFADLLVSQGHEECPVVNTLRESSGWLEDLERHVCSEGFVGCPGGEDCDSDYK